MDKEKFVKGLKTFGKIFGISLLNSMAQFTGNLETQNDTNQYISQIYERKYARAQ